MPHLKLVINGFVLICLAATMAGQASVTVTLNFPVTGSGDLPRVNLNLSGTGSFQPYGNATVAVTAPAGNGSGVTVNLVFTFSSGNTLSASTNSATLGNPGPLQGTASFSGGTGLFNGASGYLTFQIAESPGSTAGNTQGILTGSGSLTLASSSTTLQVIPQFLQFTAIQGGNTPAAQTVAVTSPGSTGQGFSIQIDQGTVGTTAPTWLSVTPLNGSTPATLTVTVNPGSLGPGTLNARIHITPQGSQSPIDVGVTLTITAAANAIQPYIAPARLLYSATQGSSLIQEQSLFVRNMGSGSWSFSAAVVGKSAWIKDVTPSSGQTGPNLPVILRVHVSAQGLGVGTYTDLVSFSGQGTATAIPVSLTVRPPGPVLKLGATGVKFEVRQGNGTSDVKNINVMNAGDPGTTVSFTATLLSGSDWATLTVPKNQATTTSPGVLTLQANASVASFPAGVRTALVQVTDPNSQNSPQLLTAVLQVDDAASFAPPDPAPAGIFLVATPGQSQATLPVVLNYSSTNPVPYQTSVATLSGANWLAVSPLVGQVSTAAPGKLTLSANAAGMKAGIYSGSASIYIGSGLRTVHATLVVPPVATAVASARSRDGAACVPQQLVIVENTLADNFVERVGFPSFLGVLIADDCGNPVLDASVVASFDNGDVPLRLDSDNATGFYGASWSPGRVFPGMSVIFDATSPTLLSPSTPTGQSSKVEGAVNTLAAGARLVGSVAANPNPLPVLSVGGTVNNLNPVALAPLAPGTIAAMYGSGLATGTGQPTGLPLATDFLGTNVRVGNLSAPLFYVSPSQIDIQIPFELAPNLSYPVVATVKGASSLPDAITVVPATPAVLQAGGNTVAQRPDLSLVSSSNPAKPGEVLVIYLVGMGTTSPSVVSGALSPASPLAKVLGQVTVDGQPAVVQFAGLTPGFVGLYQVNFVVPAGVRTGALDLVVTQNGFASNVSKLIVAR